MALEAVIYSEDPLTSYNYYKQFNSNNLYNLISGSSFYDYTNYSTLSKLENQSSYEYDHAIFDSNININSYCDNTSSSQVTDDHINNINQDVINHHSWDNHQYFSVEEAPPPPPPDAVEEVVAGGGGERRKRRRRSCKNREEVEQQRMTHIAVERNRRKQMNEYLAVIRSMMPSSYAQRGDQASIVGGAINYVKELEQHLQNLEAQKKTSNQQQEQPTNKAVIRNKIEDTSDSDEKQSNGSLIFEDFFTFPQYSNRSKTTSSIDSSSERKEEMMVIKGSESEKELAAGEIEVNMADSHANLRILTKKQPKQLLRLVTAFQGLRLTILHLNVTSFDSSVLYSFSLKVEEGSQLNSIDEIADATNHILKQIQEVDSLL